MRVRDESGAAVVELAVGMIALLPALFFVLWIGEVFHAGAKAQEGSIRAAFALTPYRLHSYSEGGAPAWLRHGARIAARHAGGAGGFDSFNGGLSATRGLMTAARFEAADCFEATPSPSVPQVLRDRTAGDFYREGFFRCQARVSVETIFLPPTLFPGFDPLAQMTTSMLLFGNGPGVRGGDAASGLYLLLDDWAMEVGTFWADGSDHAQNTLYRQTACNMALDFARPELQARAYVQVFGHGPPIASNTCRFDYVPPGEELRRTIDTGSVIVERYHSSPWDEAEISGLVQHHVSRRVFESRNSSPDHLRRR